MGLRFRKSVKMGPVRVNFSKSGVGYSVGGKGFRVTKRADGKVQTTASIPGTGISYVETLGSSKKASAAAPAAAATKASVQSTPASDPNIHYVQTQRKTPQKKSGGPKRWLAGAAAAVLVIGGGNALINGDEEPTPSGTLPNQVVTQVAPEDLTQPDIFDQITTEPEAQPETPTVEPEATPEPAPEPEPEVTPEAPAVAPSPVVTPTPQPDPEPVVTPTPQPDPEPEGPTVYVTETGKRYHHDSTCNGGTYYASTLQRALNRGLTPCQKCVQ